MSENKAPKKIYINSDYSNALQMDKDLWVESDISNHKTGYCTAPYILESEHNRIVDELKKQIALALIQYIYTEGCSCCRDVDGHEKAEKNLAELIGTPMYEDLSGYDWGKLKQLLTTK